MDHVHCWMQKSQIMVTAVTWNLWLYKDCLLHSTKYLDFCVFCQYHQHFLHMATASNGDTTLYIICTWCLTNEVLRQGYKRAEAYRLSSLVTSCKQMMWKLGLSKILLNNYQKNYESNHALWWRYLIAYLHFSTLLLEVNYFFRIIVAIHYMYWSLILIVGATSPYQAPYQGLYLHLPPCMDPLQVAYRPPR